MAALHAHGSEFGIRDAAKLPQALERPTLLWRPTQCRVCVHIVNRLPNPFVYSLRRCALTCLCWQQRRVDIADGMVVVGRQPRRQVDEIGGQERRFVQRFVKGLQRMRRRCAIARHHAHHAAASKRHANAHAGRNWSVIRRGIVEGSTQRPRHGDLNDGGIGTHGIGTHQEGPRAVSRGLAHSLSAWPPPRKHAQSNCLATSATRTR